MSRRRTSSLSKRTPTWLTPTATSTYSWLGGASFGFTFPSKAIGIACLACHHRRARWRKGLRAAAALQASELRVLITVSPLLPISEPRGFFERIAQVADGVVIDHFIRGDGTPDGSRTRATKLPAAMARFDPQTTDDKYLERMVRVAQEVMPGRVGVNVDGFAGRFLPVGVTLG